MTVIRQRIDSSIPRKRAGAASAHEKAMEKFFAAVYAAILRHLPFQTLRAIVIASPGFTKESVSQIRNETMSY
jgi:protein pelota